MGWECALHPLFEGFALRLALGALWPPLFCCASSSGPWTSVAGRVVVVALRQVRCCPRVHVSPCFLPSSPVEPAGRAGCTGGPAPLAPAASRGMSSRRRCRRLYSGPLGCAGAWAGPLPVDPGSRVVLASCSWSACDSLGRDVAGSRSLASWFGVAGVGPRCATWCALVRPGQSGAWRLAVCTSRARGRGRGRGEVQEGFTRGSREEESV